MTTRTLELPRSLAVAGGTASADLGIRLVATAIDAVIVATVTVVAGLGAHLILSILPRSVLTTESWALLGAAVVVVTIYFVYFWGREGATPGKKMLGLCVTRPGTLDTQAPVGVGRAFLRLVGFAGGSLFLVGFIVAFLHRDRRALHDLIADTIVVPRS